jgi:hypothetical protein
MDYVRTVVIAANVESLIDEPGRIPSLVSALAKEITEQKPIFAAVHLQGLRTRNRGHDTLERLVKELDNQPEIEQFSHSREYHELENLGLCSLYFVKHEARPAMYDFQKREYWSIDGHRSEDAGRSNSVQKDRLSQGYGSNDDHPVGYMLTKWRLFDRPFIFVNLNLSRDHSPLDGLVKNHHGEGLSNRRRELQTIVDSVNKHVEDDALFLAGNFNFELEKEKFLKDQTHTTHAAQHEHNDNSGKLAKLEAIDMSGRRIFTVNPTKFDFHDLHDWVFGTCNGRLIRKYDRELDSFKNKLYEAPIYFSPTGPYGYDHKGNSDYFLRSTAPSWKERVLFNEQTWGMMHHDSFASSSIYYGLVGAGANVGENKPVALISTVCLKPVKW